MTRQRAAYVDLTAMTPDEAQAAMRREWKEADFQSRVIALAQANHWEYFHPYYAQRSPVGFPDLVLVRCWEDAAPGPPYVIFAELKTERGRMSTAQCVWLFLLRRIAEQTNAIHYPLWKPSDWPRIVMVLGAVGVLTDPQEGNA